MHSGNVLRRSPLPLVKRKIRSQTPHMKLTSLNKQLQGPHMKPKRRLNTRQKGQLCKRVKMLKKGRMSPLIRPRKRQQKTRPR
ncbi:hypothetical protein Goklo_000976 [Gossypium klotzschianum]|uniref:Uncharacterized protein n=1 Tax=Gossypium klotzschianum TaxID=34286 RepID=A0A7J8VYY2_9ROSI|nr:hypothetical protein [Gossypium klotzschianum]